MMNRLVSFNETHPLRLDRLPSVMWNWQPVQLLGGRHLGTSTTLIVNVYVVLDWYGSLHCYFPDLGCVDYLIRNATILVMEVLQLSLVSASGHFVLHDTVVYGLGTL